MWVKSQQVAGTEGRNVNIVVHLYLETVRHKITPFKLYDKLNVLDEFGVVLLVEERISVACEIPSLHNMEMKMLGITKSHLSWT